MEDSGDLIPLSSKPQGRCLTFFTPKILINELGQVPNLCLFSNLRAQCFFPKIHTKFPNLQGRMLVNMRAHEDLLGEANIGGNDLPWKQRAAMSGHERPQKRDLAASCPRQGTKATRLCHFLKRSNTHYLPKQACHIYLAVVF